MEFGTKNGRQNTKRRLFPTAINYNSSSPFGQGKDDHEPKNGQERHPFDALTEELEGYPWFVFLAKRVKNRSNTAPTDTTHNNPNSSTSNRADLTIMTKLRDISSFGDEADEEEDEKTIDSDDDETEDGAEEEEEEEEENDDDDDEKPFFGKVTTKSVVKRANSSVHTTKGRRKKSGAVVSQKRRRNKHTGDQMILSISQWPARDISFYNHYGGARNIAAHVYQHANENLNDTKKNDAIEPQEGHSIPLRNVEQEAKEGEAEKVSSVRIEVTPANELTEQQNRSNDDKEKSKANEDSVFDATVKLERMKVYGVLESEMPKSMAVYYNRSLGNVATTSPKVNITTLARCYGADFKDIESLLTSPEASSLMPQYLKECEKQGDDSTITPSIPAETTHTTPHSNGINRVIQCVTSLALSSLSFPNDEKRKRKRRKRDTNSVYVLVLVVGEFSIKKDALNFMTLLKHKSRGSIPRTAWCGALSEHFGKETYVDMKEILKEGEECEKGDGVT